MNSKSIKLVVSFILIMIFSCDEPETVVTNIVHPDGSVTRKIEMKCVKNNFEVSNLQVPFDSTWIVKDSLEFTEKGDTIWVKRAEKLFKNIDEINRTYQADSGANKDISRRAEFKKKFKWFNTEYRYAEIIDKSMSDGYPVKDFLNQEELQWFYSPEKLTEEKKNGTDSLKFKALSDATDKKSEKWLLKNLASEWINEFVRLTEGRAGNEMTKESLKTRENDFVRMMESNDIKFDSLWYAGVLFKDLVGEVNALKFQAEADSAYDLAKEHVFISFNNYTVRIAMPGKLIGTNGFMDTTKISLWPVNSDYFLTQPYEMWAESKTPNRWTWIVSGVFLVFVLAGIIFRIIKK
jgi:hypothetical protein